MNRFLCLFIFTALAISQSGCKKEAQADSSKPLEKSFQAAEPELKQAIHTVTASLKDEKYTEATRALEPIVSGRPLTDPQKQAIGIALKQINQAIVANPALDTKKMYEARRKVFDAVHRGPRS